jgi:hypothetical protein
MTDYHKLNTQSMEAYFELLGSQQNVGAGLALPSLQIRKQIE